MVAVNNIEHFLGEKAEVCHIYFAQSAESYELVEEACSPMPGFVELPTCPVCLWLMVLIIWCFQQETTSLLHH
ncbi:hypothetical protein ACSBR1_027352 [Camellia fascicularis]